MAYYLQYQYALVWIFNIMSSDRFNNLASRKLVKMIIVVSVALPILLAVIISFAMRDKYNPKHDLAELPANMQAELLFKHYIADSDRFYVYALTGELDAEDKSSWQPANWQANDKAFSEALSWTKSFVYTYIKEKEFSGKLSDLLLNAQFDKQLMYRTIAKHKLYIYHPATKSGYLFVYTPH